MVYSTSEASAVPVLSANSVVDASSIDPIAGEWFEFDNRENSTMASTWTERLCLRQDGSGFEIAICINGAVGEDSGPSTYDEDDDEPCEWRLPAFHEGHLVAISEDGLLCGPLLVSPEDASVHVPEIGHAQVKEALERLEWRSSEATIAAAIRASQRGANASALAPNLIDAYRATAYRVEAGNQSFDLRVGELSAPLGELYEREKRDTATFVTAWNPFGKELDHAENERRHAALLEDVTSLSLPYFEGAGRGDDETWEPEQSILVLGLTFEQALHLGRHHEQNAIIWASHDAIPTLILLR